MVYRTFSSSAAYLKAVAAVALAAALHAALDRVLHDTPPSVFYFAAVCYSAWSAGPKPALLALGLGFVCAAHFLIAPRGLPVPDRVHAAAALVYFSVGLLIVPCVLRVRRQLDRARQAAALTLEQKRALEQELERQRRIEAGLIERERFLSTLVENSPDVVARLDRELRYLYISPSATRYLGLHPGDCVGKTGAELGIAPERWHGFAAACREALAGGGPARHEFEQRLEGETHCLETRITPERGADGAVATLLLLTTDVTERRTAERALRESESRLNAILQATTAVIYLMSEDSRFVHINRGFEQYIGLKQDDVRGRSVYEIFPRHVAADFERNNRRVIAEDRVLEFEEVAPHADGLHYYTSVKAPLRDENGRPAGVVGVSTDITDRKRMEEQLREADRRKDEFLATLAHELRNPLAPIRNALELLRRSDEAGLRERALAGMERQVTQMVRLIDDLLELSRITHDTLELRTARLELGRIIEHVLETCRPQLEQGRHRLVTRLPDQPVPLQADGARLEQVFCNLISNACKYSEAGSRIELSAETIGNEVEIAIEDEGMGIPPSLLPRVFDMFMQVDRSLERTQGGLGIGLALAKRLIEMHGGSIRAQSEGPGTGSRFIVRLPIASAPAEPPPRSEARRKPAAKPIRRRILVVDDNIDAVESLALLLGFTGHEVYTARDGHEALEQAEKHRPEIVLLDIGLPKMNGYDVAQAIRQRPWSRATRIVALTGWGQEQDRRRSAEAGFDHHLVKPVVPAVLFQLFAEMDAAPPRT